MLEPIEGSFSWNEMGELSELVILKGGVTSHQGGSGCSVISLSAGSTVIRLLSHEGGLSSGRSHQAAVSWGWSLVRVVQAAHCIAHQGGLIRVVSSGYLSHQGGLIRLLPHQGGFSSGWSCHQGDLSSGGLSSGVTLVVSHQGSHQGGLS